MSDLLIVDTESMEWENGLDVVNKMAPEFRDNLGAANEVTKMYVKYNQKTLLTDPETTRRGDLIRLDPGYSDVTHAYHDSVEECFILNGECYLLGEGPLLKGEYFWRPPGWVHSAKTEGGFVGLLFLEGMSERDGSGPVSRRIRPPEDLGSNPLYPNQEKAMGPRGWVRRLDTSLLPWQRGPVFARPEGTFDGYDLDNISFKILSKNPSTGAQSLLVRLDPGYCQEEPGLHSATQQFFVISGSLSIGDRRVGRGGYAYRRARSVQPPVTSVEGAVLFMKVDGWLDFDRVTS